MGRVWRKNAEIKALCGIFGACWMNEKGTKWGIYVYAYRQNGGLVEVDIPESVTK